VRAELVEELRGTFADLMNSQKGSQLMLKVAELGDTKTRTIVVGEVFADEAKLLRICMTKGGAAVCRGALKHPLTNLHQPSHPVLPVINVLNVLYNRSSSISSRGLTTRGKSSSCTACSRSRVPSLPCSRTRTPRACCCTASSISRQ
jgi:hypothetical protein